AVLGASEDYVAVLAASTLSRPGNDNAYRYGMVYLDIWVRTPAGWRLKDDSPIRVESSYSAPKSSSKPDSATAKLLPCGLRSGTNSGVGLTPPDRFLAAEGRFRALMLFTDHSLYGHTASIEEIYARVATPLMDQLASESRGRLTLEIKPFPKMVRYTKEL